jgi:hypothetical protein
MWDPIFILIWSSIEKLIEMDAHAQRTLVIFALVAARVLSVQVVDLMLFLEAEAKGCESGYATL